LFSPQNEQTILLDDYPIVSLCTPQGSGALALIRISGTGSVELVDKMAALSSKKKLAELPTHTIHHGHVVDSNDIVDEVLFFLMRAPRTFTGQDTVEISSHNNPFIINHIITLAVQHGAHHAQRGEFTKRAFLNKKIDLLQAEAINDLISAQTELALKKSIAQLKGSLSSEIQHLETKILMLLALVETSFEFLEEEQQDLNIDVTIKQHLATLIEAIETCLADFPQQQQIRQGIRIAIIGNTNVGKSMLFNTLVHQERAIVTDIPGTTRDAIETSQYRNGNFWLIVDTAGVRDTQDTIEQKGIDRSWHEGAQADIILLVADITNTENQALYEKIWNTYPVKTILVANKVDLTPHLQLPIHEPFLYVSAKNKIGIDTLETAIQQKIDQIFATAQAPFLLNQRQHDILVEIHTKLKQLEQQNINRVDYEIMAYDLKLILEVVSQLTGKNISEQMIEAVFNTFCVGK
jgi:tRNA modification GTPase TrmE